MKLSEQYIDQVVETEDSIDRTEVGLDMNKIIGHVISEVIQGILTDKIAEESIEIIAGMKVMTEAGTDLEKGHSPETLSAIEIGVQATVGPDQDQEPLQIETEYNVKSVGNMIILQRTAPLLEKREK